jgi:hypothetical protein
LLEHQIDFDYFDEQSLSSVATLDKDGFRNLSGQVYRAVIVPSSIVISRASLDRLRAFANGGGKVIFMGETPTMVVDRTFLHPGPAPDLGFAMHELSGDLTPAVIANLPPPDFALDQPATAIKYNHRSWRDADLYFIFNESNAELTRTATIAGRLPAQVWDMSNGQIHPILDATSQGGKVQFPLVLEPYEAMVIVLGSSVKGGSPEPKLLSRKVVQELDGDWSIKSGAESFTSPLKSWQDLGIKHISSPGTYAKEFQLNSKPAGKHRMLLECEDVRDYAHLRLNGVDLDARGWQPYRWDVTKALKPGNNVLEIEVRAAPAGRGPGRPSAPQPAGLLGPVRIVSTD